MQQFDCDGLAKTLFDILKLVVDVKMWSHLLGIESYFWLFSSTLDGLKVSTLFMSLLCSPVKASQFPFVHQEFYVETMVPEIQKDVNLATSTKLLKPCSLKDQSQSWGSLINTSLVGFPAQQKGALWLSTLFNKFMFLGIRFWLPTNDYFKNICKLFHKFQTQNVQHICNF